MEIIWIDQHFPWKILKKGWKPIFFTEMDLIFDLKIFDLI